MPLADGEVFAGYTILRVLGTGGMGEVYLAEHPRLPRRDALKVLGTAVSHDDEYRRRFNQEADMVATLRHPNIVTIYDRGDCGGQLWISMEFIDGTDASRLLTERYPGGIPAAQVVRIVGAVADALDYAHSRHLLHRDIKPANILLGHSDSGDGVDPAGRSAATRGIDRIMLADFGVARWAGQTSYLTEADMTVGTVTYAAPEQLKGEEIDGHADQYSLAATAFHLLTGAAPFDNTNPAVVISAHLSAPPPEIGSGDPELGRFGPVFARALAKDPADRFDRCGDFARALQDALVPTGGAARHRKGGPGPGPDRGRSRWVTAGLGGLLLAGALVAAAVLASRHRSSESDPTPTSPPPPAVSARMDLPVVLIGADCAVLGAAAVTETGAPAYCARADLQPGATVWSLQPQELRTTAPPATP
jgi:serine/threonine-protein kinase